MIEPDALSPDPGETSRLVLVAIGLGFAASALQHCRFALDGFSRTRFLQAIPEARRARIESCCDRIERTRASVLVACVACEALLVIDLDLLFATWLSRVVAALVAIGISLAWIVPFCRILPRVITAHGVEPVLARLFPALDLLGVLLSPLAQPMLWFKGWLGRVTGQDQRTLDGAFAEEIIAAVEEGEREGAVAQDQAQLIEKVVEFQDVAVSEAMTPRTEMDWVDAAVSVKDALLFAAEKGHSRLPVAQDDADHIVGVFYVRDVIDRLTDLEWLQASPVRDVTRKPYFVPDSKKVSDLLKEFKHHKLQIAIVLDEYGGTAGLVTIEDVLEMLVGDITDEHDPGEGTPRLKKIDANLAEADARTLVRELSEALEIELPESPDFDTIGGLVLSELGRVPGKGDRVSLENGVEIEVVDADERRVKRVRVRVMTRPNAG